MAKSASPHKTRNATLISALLVTASSFAHAATPDCSVSDSFECRMRGLLRFLDIAAIVLAVLLLVVVALAVRYYRSHSRSDERKSAVSKRHRTTRT